MTKLASIQKIVEVRHHNNADKLDIVKVLGYEAIVNRDAWKVGDLCVFIEPDSVLPSDKKWTEFYRAKSSRVRAIRLRGSWSFGIVESLSNLELMPSIFDNAKDMAGLEGTDLTETL